MDSEKPDDKDGSKDSGEKEYRGVHKTKYGNFVARCGSGPNRHLGTFDTAAEAASAYDVRAREIHGPKADLNFPDSPVDDNSSPAPEFALPVATPSVADVQGVRSYDVREFHGPQADLNSPDSDTHDNSSPATESTLPVAIPSVTDVQGVPSGSSNAITKNIGEKRKHIIIITSELDVVEAGPCAKAVHNVPQFRTEDDFLPATGSALPIRSESANILDEQHLEKSVLAEVSTRGGIIGSPGSTTIAVTEPHAAAGEVILPSATNNALRVAESSVTGVANRPESANIPIEQEEVVNKYIEYVKSLFDEEDDDHDPSDQEKLNQYVEDLTNLISDKKGSKSS